MKALPNTICPVCSGANLCVPATAGKLDMECWCMNAAIGSEALGRVPANLANKACLCPRCATGLGASNDE